MEEKRLMDNKHVKNPLLTAENLNCFLQDFVQSTLIVPAAPPRNLQSTAGECITCSIIWKQQLFCFIYYRSSLIDPFLKHSIKLKLRKVMKFWGNNQIF